MKILILLPDNGLGGAEQYLKMIAEYYLKKNAHITIVFLYDRFDNSWLNLRDRKNVEYKLYTGKFKFLNIIKFITYLLYINTNKFDYVYSSHVKTTSLLGVLFRFNIFKKDFFIARESTTVFTRFKGKELRLYKILYKIGYSKVDLLICQTKVMKDQLLNVYPNFKKNTVVIPNPVDRDLISSSEIKEIEEIKNFHNYLVSAGRLIPEKGFDVLIKAFQILKKESNKKLKLILLGEGPERSKLEGLIRELNLEEEVILKGIVLNVYPYFKNAMACIVSSRIEGFPNVLLQMMSQNEKILSTDCAGGISDIPSITVCKTDDVQDLKNGLLELLTKDTVGNRKIYNEYLDKRNIASFIEIVENNLLTLN
ncbi:glycosyltransferase [Algibacter aquimarinus]|uniref:Uncharacterized protein n=1 Tax=Algibacter aquimarinus TaxID=1136748 RepID=A0ABP9HCJ7_9FLAO